jgi:hypothetical protein
MRLVSMTGDTTPLGLPPAIADVPLPDVIQLDVDAVEAQRSFAGVTRVDLARRWWDVHPSTAGRILDGLMPCSESRLRVLALALGCDPRLLIVAPRKVAA